MMHEKREKAFADFIYTVCVAVTLTSFIVTNVIHWNQLYDRFVLIALNITMNR